MTLPIHAARLPRVGTLHFSAEGFAPRLRIVGEPAWPLAPDEADAVTAHYLMTLATRPDEHAEQRLAPVRWDPLRRELQLARRGVSEERALHAALAAHAGRCDALSLGYPFLHGPAVLIGVQGPGGEGLAFIEHEEPHPRVHAGLELELRAIVDGQTVQQTLAARFGRRLAGHAEPPDGWGSRLTVHGLIGCRVTGRLAFVARLDLDDDGAHPACARLWAHLRAESIGGFREPNAFARLVAGRCPPMSSLWIWAVALLHHGRSRCAR